MSDHFHQGAPRDDERRGRPPPTRPPAGYLSDHFEPHPLPPGTSNSGTPNYIDVMSSDGVSTVTGPMGGDDTFDPVGVYLPPSQQQLAIADEYYGQQQQQQTRYQHQELHQTGDDHDQNNHDPYMDEFQTGGEGGRIPAGVVVPPLTQRPTTSDGDLDQFDDFPGDDPEHPLQTGGDPDSFRRNEYNARVEEWYNTMELTAEENEESTRQTLENYDDEHDFYPPIGGIDSHSPLPDRPPAPSPGANMMNHHQQQGRPTPPPGRQPLPRPPPPPLPPTVAMGGNVNYNSNNNGGNKHNPNAQRPPYTYPKNPSSPPPRRPHANQNYTPPPTNTNSNSVTSNDEPGGVRACWLILACLILIVVVVGACFTFLYLFTDIVSFSSGSSSNETARDSDSLPPTPSPTMSTLLESLSPTVEQLSLQTVETFDGPESYGSSVAISGRFFVVGSPSNSLGIVSSFVDKAGNGASYTFIPELAGIAGFGTDFALVQLNNDNDDSLLLVGSPNDESGKVYLYRYQTSNGRWTLQSNDSGTLTGAGAANEAFGTSIAVSSQPPRIVIGAPGFQAGRVFTFFLTNGDVDGEFAAAPLLSEPLVGTALNAKFGTAVDISIDGDLMAVGEPGQSSFSIFGWDGGDWNKEFSFTLSQADDLGSSVAFLSSNFVAAGGPSFDNGRGLVRVFQKDETGDWTPLPAIVGRNAGDRLGEPHSLSGLERVLGQPEVVLGTANGDIERYDLIGGQWQLRFSLDGSNGGVTAIDVFRATESTQLSILAGFRDTNTAILYQSSDSGGPGPTTNSPAAINTPTSSPTQSPVSILATSEPTLRPTTSSPSAAPTPGPTSAPSILQEWQLVGGPLTGSEVDARFGHAVALVGDFLAIGEPNKGALAQGDVTVLQLSSDFSSFEFDFSLGTVEFGFSLDAALVSGTPSIIVGAINTEFINEFTRFGSAHYFEFDGERWAEVGGTLTPDLVLQESASEFGRSVALASETRRIAIGAPSSSVSLEIKDTGRVYTFEFDGNDWIPLADPLVGAASGALLGFSVDLSPNGEKLLVGAPGDSGGDGSATLYEWTGSTWNATFSVQGDFGLQESLGTTVAILSEDAIAFGGPDLGDNQGIIRVYETLDGASYQKAIDLVGEANQRIGTTLSGANNGHVAFGSDDGSFHVYGTTGSVWLEIPITGGPTNLGSAVQSISMSGSTVAVGLEGEHVVVYDFV